MPQRYSIDFGTTNSVVARWQGEKHETVPLPGLSILAGENYLIPSLLYVRDGRTEDVVVGAAVRAGGYDSLPGHRLFRNFKRGIAHPAGLEAHLIDGVPWSEADAGRIFLRRLLQALPCPLDEIEQLVITVPVATFEGYTAWLNAALTGFAPGRIRIVDESTAAALGYAVTEPGANVLIGDFGGGTLDLSLVRLPEAGGQPGSSLGRMAGTGAGAAARVIAKTGLALGGSDIDRWLLAEVQQRAPLSSVAPDEPALLSACEAAKVRLSETETTAIEFRLPDGSMDACVFTRAELEALMERHGFYAALRGALQRLMGQAHQRGVFKEDIRHVLLVGGTSLVPSVQRAYDTFFRDVTHGRRKTSLPAWPALNWTVENTTVRVDRPFTAVVEGALQISAGLGLDDRLAHSYGLRVSTPAGGMRYEEIIPAGGSCPSAPVTVQLGASSLGQTAIDFVVGQIDAGAVTAIEVRYEAGHPVFVSPTGDDVQAVTPLNDADPIRVTLDPPGTPGKARLAAVFRVDEARRVRLSVTDLKTRRRLVDDTILAASGSPKNRQPGPGGPPALAGGSRGGGYRLSLRGLASALNLLHPEQVSTSVLAAALRSSDTLVRFNAADLLCRRGDCDARLALEELLADGTPPQRASAVQHLYRFSWFAARPLFEQALADPDERVRAGAVFALCRMHDTEAYRLTREVLRSPGASDALREAAVWGVFHHPDAGAVPVLEYALVAANIETREAALEALGATGSADGISMARRALDDPDPAIKYAATLSWLELAGESCLGELADVLAATRGEARCAIVRGFFHATNYTGLDVSLSPLAARMICALQEALTDELPRTRSAAALPLAWIRHPHAERALREGFQAEADPDVKSQMLRVAVHLSSPAAGDLLEAARSDEETLVRQTAEYLSNHNAVPR